MSDLHYGFPPAAAYPVNRCLFALKSDAAFRARFTADPAAAMEEMGVPAAQRPALAALDREALLAAGAHPYLVFMAALRVKMDREPETLELF